MASQKESERLCSTIIDAQFSLSHDMSLAKKFSNDQSFEERLTEKIAAGKWKLSNDSLLRYSEDGSTTSATYSKIMKYTRNRHDKRWFCLECWTQDDKLLIFLMIPHRRYGDEWEQVLRNITDPQHECNNKRGVSEYNRQPAQFSPEVGRKRAQSEYSTLGGFKPHDSNGYGDGGLYVSCKKEHDDTQNNNNNKTMNIEEAKISPPCSLLSDQSSGSDPGSLNSFDEPTDFNSKLRKLREERDQESVIKTFMKGDLDGKLDLAELNKKVYVVRWQHPPVDLNSHGFIPLFPGDRIRQINKQLVDNVKSVHDFIRTSATKEVTLIVERAPCGTVVAVQVSSFEDLGIELKGSEIQNMDPQKALRAHCDPLLVCFGETRSKRSITAIGVFGNQRVPFDAQTEEAKKMLIDSIGYVRGMEEQLVLHLHPTAFLMALKRPKIVITDHTSDSANVNRHDRRLSVLTCVHEADE